MPVIRRLIAQHHLAALICAAALLLKLLVPTGYMIGSDHGAMAITICTGMAPATAMTDMPVMDGDMADHGKSKDQVRPSSPAPSRGCRPR